jgi:hypothetical protein
MDPSPFTNDIHIVHRRIAWGVNSILDPSWENNSDTGMNIIPFMDVNLTNEYACWSDRDVRQLFMISFFFTWLLTLDWARSWLMKYSSIPGTSSTEFLGPVGNLPGA